MKKKRQMNNNYSLIVNDVTSFPSLCCSAVPDIKAWSKATEPIAACDK